MLSLINQATVLSIKCPKTQSYLVYNDRKQILTSAKLQPENDVLGKWLIQLSKLTINFLFSSAPASSRLTRCGCFSLFSNSVVPFFAKKWTKSHFLIDHHRWSNHLVKMILSVKSSLVAIFILLLLSAIAWNEKKYFFFLSKFTLLCLHLRTNYCENTSLALCWPPELNCSWKHQELTIPVLLLCWLCKNGLFPRWCQSDVRVPSTSVPLLTAPSAPGGDTTTNRPHSTTETESFKWLMDFEWGRLS